MIELKINSKLLDIDLKINQGEFLVLTGVSGSGKTTILRTLAGLQTDDSVVKVDGKIWQDNKKFVPLQQRNIGFVFQDYALFENMTIEQNLLFIDNNKILCKDLLESMNMYDIRKQKVNTLSGGQQQRTSLCRALMGDPKILLLDEPFSALDDSIKYKLYDLLKQFYKQHDVTIIMTSHNTKEIDYFATRILSIKNK